MCSSLVARNLCVHFRSWASHFPAGTQLPLTQQETQCWPDLPQTTTAHTSPSHGCPRITQPRLPMHHPAMAVHTSPSHGCPRITQPRLSMHHPATAVHTSPSHSCPRITQPWLPTHPPWLPTHHPDMTAHTSPSHGCPLQLSGSHLSPVLPDSKAECWCPSPATTSICLQSATGSLQTFTWP